MRISTSDNRRTAEKLTEFVKTEAVRLGFSDCRIVQADAVAHAGDDLAAFIKAGYHGTMAWMADTSERRSAPSTLWGDVRNIIVLTMNYGPEDDPSGALGDPECGSISVYARNQVGS